MKQLFIIVLVFIAFHGFSQKGLLLQEDFSSEQVPAEGWTIDAQENNWSANVTSNAGGDAPEARFSWSPQFTGDSRMISPVIDVSSYTTLRLAFKHAVDHYGGGYTLGVATTSDGGTTWNDVWTGGGESIVESIDLEISTADASSETFQFCVYFSGESYNINYWYLDDIVLYAPENIDLLMSGLLVPDYMAEADVTIEARVSNFGITEITSFDAYWSVDGGTEHMQTVSGVSLSTGDSHTFAFDNVYSATAGDHELEVWIANVNGSGDDDDVSNDMMGKTLHVATQSVSNLPLFEEFTSSTCGPCASFNNSVFTPFLEDNEGELAIIKYQMDWPGSGDPYYTEEGGVRRFYYGVSGVPQLFTGGYNTSTSAAAVNTAFDEQLAKPAFISLNANYYVDEEAQTVDVNIDFTPYFNGNGFTLHAVVVEKTTVENTGSNGETEFHQVMMKMLPDAEGTSLTMETDVPQYYSFNAIDLSGTNVEEFNDLAVVVFIQNNITKEIFQAANAEMAYQIQFNVHNENEEPIQDANIECAGQEVVTSADGLAAVELTNGEYTYGISHDNYEEITDVFTVSSMSFTLNITMDPVGVASVSQDLVNVYPVPATQVVNIEGDDVQFIKLYSIVGELIKDIPVTEDKVQLPVSNLNPGTYFMNIMTEEGNCMKKIVVK